MICGVDIDTSFFTGNYAPKVSLQSACLEGGMLDETGAATGFGVFDWSASTNSFCLEAHKTLKQSIIIKK